MITKDLFNIDFIGIGAAKSGTTWLANMLDAHPDICMSEPKEVNYFNYGDTFTNQYYYRRKHRGINPNFKKPLSWYKKHFTHCASTKKIGEFSVLYLYDHKAPRRIKETFPDVKLIAVLRNPIDRLYSDYWMYRGSFKFEDRPFKQAITEEPKYVARSMYFGQISRFLEYFDKDQLLILLYDDIVRDPAGILKTTYGFLGVDDSFIPNNMNKRSNYSKQGRYRGVVKTMDIVVRKMVQLRLGFVVRLLKNFRVNKLILSMISKKYSYPRMDKETRQYLRSLFNEDIRKLEVLLDRDLSYWQ